MRCSDEQDVSITQPGNEVCVENRAVATNEDMLHLHSILVNSIPQGSSTNVAMIAFILPLTFGVGLPHHSTIMITSDETVEGLEGRQWFVTDDGPEVPDFGNRLSVSVRVWRPRKQEVLLNSLVQDMNRVFEALAGGKEIGEIDFTSPETAGTVLEASTILYMDEPNENESLALSRAFDRCIEAVSLLLRSIRIATGDFRILPIGMMSLPSSIPYIVRFGEDLQQRFTGLFLVNMGHSLPVLKTDEISIEVARSALERVRRSMHGFPIVEVEDAHARAMRSFFVESDYAAATIFSYTAVEVFCNALLSLLMWESGRLRSENVEWLTTQGFETRLRRHYPPLLGGNWDFKSSSSPVHILEEVSRARHRFLHAGKAPSIRQAELALDAYSVVTEFAKDRLVGKLYDYPRTALMILGEPGLRRKKAWTRRFQRLLDEIVNEDDWHMAFADWMASSPNT